MSTVVLIEDQVSYGDAFALAMSLTKDLDLIARASDAASGVAICVNERPDVVVTDYRLPDGATGTEVAKRLREAGLEVPIGVLTGFLAPAVQRESAELPRVFTFSKDESITEILQWIRDMLSGAALPASPSASKLSPGELEVLELLNQGHSPTDIAGILYLSLHTIRSRIKSTHRKLGVASQIEAIAVATRQGLLVPPT